MDFASSVVFSVNPPSPLESELCADDQESILRTWHTCESPTEISSNSSCSEAYTRFEPDVMDRGMITPSSSAEAALPSSVNIRTITQPSRSAGSLGLYSHTGKSEPSGKRSHGGPRRSSSNDTHRASNEMHKKSELYKTELCVSINAGIPCKYGENCQFAHSMQELQHVIRHPRYKTQYCTSFQSQGYCKYNDRCTFIHHPDEARALLTSSPKEIKSDKSKLSKSTPSSANSGSSAVTSAPAQETNITERLRTLSDPGIGFTNTSKRPIKTLDMINSSIPATGTTISHILQDIPATNSSSQDIDEQIEYQEYRGLDPQSILKPPSDIVISHKSDTITPTGEVLGHHQNVSDYTVPIHYTSELSVAPASCLDFRQESVTIAPIALTSSIWSSSLVQRDPANPWREAINNDDDEEWASKLAYYISTPQNDFDI
ncbi:hypothetical protein BGZ46_005921 [Entomortierella lignicola]|nr:hypothetical protein BGZ46_005921 [Entomortierella lignicola]